MSALHNSGINDIFTILNSAWPVSLGGTGGTTAITSWDAITAKGTDIPSASTIVLTTATGPRIDITGVTAITAVTLANGSMRIARATGIFVLTASATLIVNKSTTVNYTTAVGDLMIFTAEGGVTSVTVIGSAAAFPDQSTLTYKYTDAGAGSGPGFELYRDSASPAASDALGVLWFYGRDSAANKQNYADMYAVIISPTSTTESGALNIETIQAGVNALRLTIGAGLYTANATGGDKGVDTINAANYYKNGVLANPGLVLLTSGSVAAAATLDIVLTAYTGYRGLRLLLSNWLPATSSTDLYLRFSTDGGSTYLTTGYLYAVNRIAGGATNNPAGGSAQAQIPMLGGAFSENTNSGIDVVIDIQGQTSTARYGKAQFRATYASGGPAQDAMGSGLQATANDVDAIRLLFSSGNITSGNYALYGYP